MTTSAGFPSEEPLAFLVGPTAVGKSALALELAASRGWTIVSLDSMQVYRGMDIGTSKPSPADQARVRHRCIDLVLPSERYDVRRYLADASAALAEIRASSGQALFVGDWALTQLWLFWVAPIVGAAIAGIVWKIVDDDD